MAPTLTETKMHLRVSDDAEDLLLASYIDAAERSLLDYLGTEELPDSPAVHAAALMMVGSLFEHREGLTEKPLIANPLVQRLLAPYREMGF